MQRIIATSIVLLLLGMPAAAGADTLGDETTEIDTATTLVPDGHAAVAEVDFTGDSPDLELTTRPAAEVLPSKTLQAEEVDRPNCLLADEGSADLGYGALNAGGETLAPLVDAGVAQPCEHQRYDTGIDTVTFVTVSQSETRVTGFEHAGWIGGGNMWVDCSGTDAALGSFGDMQTVECEAGYNGDDPSGWGNWDGSVIREDGNGTSYASILTQ